MSDMTKKQARKIATLRMAALANQDDTETGKVAKQQRWLAQSLARRYGIDIHDVPAHTQKIRDYVMSGKL